MVAEDLMADADPAAPARRQRVAPADGVGGLADRLLPVAVGRLVARHDLLAAAGEVAQPDLQPVDAQAPGGLVHLRLHRPGDLRRPEPAERRRRRGVRQQARGRAPGHRAPGRARTSGRSTSR